MSIRRRCQIASVLVAALLVVAFGVMAYKVNEIRVDGPIDRAGQQIDGLLAAILPPPSYVIEPYLEASLLINDAASLPQRRDTLRRLEKIYRADMASWRGSSLDDELRKALTNGSGQEAELFWDELNRHLLPAIARGDTAAARASYARLSMVYAKHRGAIDRLVTASSTRRDELTASSHDRLRVTVIVLIAVALMVGGLLAFGLRALFRGVLSPVAGTADAMRRMAGGDLQVDLPGRDRTDEIGTMIAAVEVFRTTSRAQRDGAARQEAVVTELAAALGRLGDGDLRYRIGDALPDDYRALARSYDETMDQLSATMEKVVASAGRVHDGSTEIRTASDDMSQRTEQQAASLEETAAAMDEITATVRGTAEGAAKAQQAVDLAHHEAEKSGTVVQRAVEAMAGIERSSNEIGEIIAVIDGIAFQTNLLALNAGVEAARAGDAGKGFAVVASEVRALAQRSADAAKDVKTRITASSQQVDTGVEMVTAAGTALRRIIDRIAEIDALVSMIAQSAEQQATGLQQVNTAVGEMDGVTQQNAAMVEESTAAARSLADEAGELMAAMERFRLRATETAARSPVHRLHDRIGAGMRASATR